MNDTANPARATERRYEPVTKGGRSWNGAHRDRGRVVHAARPRPDGHAGDDFRTALCGAIPGRRSYGWTVQPEADVTCARCRRAIEAAPPAEAPPPRSSAMPTPAPSDAAHVAHTPTPWHVDATGCYIADANGGTVAKTTGNIREYRTDKLTSGQNSEERANARHIVRCVNAHDALVSALRSLWDYYCSGLWHDEDDEAIRQNVNRALSLATEGQD